MHIPFFVGIMEGISNNATFIDGNEEAYYYTSPLEYYMVRSVLMDEAKALVPADLWTKHTASFRIGHAIAPEYIQGNWLGMKPFPYRLTVFSCRQKSAPDVQKEQIQDNKTDVALTPPMGWNSYNCYGATVTADMIANTSDTCRWLNTMYGIDMTKDGAQDYYNSLFKLYASWGVDYVKVDDIATPYHAPEIEAVRKAIDNCGRSMVLSLSPGDDMPSEHAEHVKKYTNMWRISADFWDEWESLKKQFELCNKWSSVSGPGHWPDADMLTLGRLNRRGPNPGLERMTNFSEEEQKTMMTLWPIFRSPLMMGGDLITLDNYTRILLTNSEVIQVNQKSENNRQLFRDGDKIAWVADVPGSSDKYLALFYTGDLTASELTVNLSGLGFNGSCKVRDLWNHLETDNVSGDFIISLPSHGAGLYKVIH